MTFKTKLTWAPRRLGLDTVMDTRPYLEGLWKAGVRTIFRYIPRTTNPPSWLIMLTEPELEAICSQGFVASCVQQGIGGLSATGRASGEHEAKQAADYARVKLKLPDWTTLWCDCEWSQRTKPPKRERVEYLEGWAQTCVNEGYRSGLYVCQTLGLTAAELYKLPGFTAYWKAASYTMTVDTRGFQVLQSLEYRFSRGTFYPWRDSYINKPGLRCDLDMICIDGKGSYLAAVGGENIGD